MSDHSNPNRNRNLLRRRLRAKLKSVEPPQLAEEIIDGLVFLADFPEFQTILRSMNSDLFCPFCGKLHELEDCQAENVDEYRRDPQAYIRRYIPVALHGMVKTVKVESPPRPEIVLKGKVGEPQPAAQSLSVQVNVPENAEEYDKLASEAGYPEHLVKQTGLTLEQAFEESLKNIQAKTDESPAE